jgi:thiamine pyrophosphate-dependent acetolactate synthase large subunit-like protein
MRALEEFAGICRTGNKSIVDSGTDLENPDFAKIAEAVGLVGLTADTPDQVRPAIKDALIG